MDPVTKESVIWFSTTQCSYKNHLVIYYQAELVHWASRKRDSWSGRNYSELHQNNTNCSKAFKDALLQIQSKFRLKPCAHLISLLFQTQMTQLIWWLCDSRYCIAIVLFFLGFTLWWFLFKQSWKFPVVWFPYSDTLLFFQALFQFASHFTFLTLVLKVFNKCLVFLNHCPLCFWLYSHLPVRSTCNLWGNVIKTPITVNRIIMRYSYNIFWRTVDEINTWYWKSVM